MVKIEPDIRNGLSKLSSADCFQLRSVSYDRFIKQIGEVSESIMEDIRTGISKVLSMYEF